MKPERYSLRNTLALVFLVIVVLVVANRVRNEQTYTITQYRDDGTVQQTHQASRYWANGGCIGYRLAGEDDRYTSLYSCGNVVAEGPSVAERGNASYIVTQYGGDGNVIRQWSATSASNNGGCIEFKAVGDSNTSIACGTVVAEATVPSHKSSGSFTISVLKDDGTAIQTWAVTRFEMNNGVISFYVAGDPTHKLHHVTGNVQVTQAK